MTRWDYTFFRTVPTTNFRRFSKFCQIIILLKRSKGTIPYTLSLVAVMLGTGLKKFLHFII